ncbi:bacillithiol biosynthesis deacetylase BshB1 [Thermus igniterrae]|jgi:bacillithiol biosynthesis deacetylase BshB1|uniref:bacillithiol biosynthesis deacetylase BshB1 n=1 Tax=Thermus igniterrae TaxID=88189 RepID=UPI00036CB07A|nr:bacillithiol biosynthesis deacetylase BshB1 [Thermus igniterrae]
MLDLLVVAPHPDDGELGCGGTLARAKAEGLTTGILDLTRGEMGSKGSAEERAREVVEASRILGLDFRGNLELPDGGLMDVPEQRLRLAEALRRLRPRIVFAPLEADRHPDHTAASRLAVAAVHLAGLRKAPLEGEPHRVERLFFYPGNHPFTPSFLVKISAFIDRWEQAVLAYKSQFAGEAVSETVGPKGVEARKALRRHFGNYLGVDYAEPFVSPLPVLYTPWSRA